MDSVLVSGLFVDPVSIAVKCGKLSAALDQANKARGAKLGEFARYMDDTGAYIRGIQGHLPATSDHTLRCLEGKLMEASMKLEQYQSRNVFSGGVRAKTEARQLDQLMQEIYGLVKQLFAAAAAHRTSAPQQAQQPQQPMYPQPLFAQPQPALPAWQQLPQLPLFSQQAQQPQRALSALQAISGVQQTQSQQMLAQLQAQNVQNAQLQAHYAQLQAQSAQQAQQAMAQLQAGSLQSQASKYVMQQMYEQISGTGLVSNPLEGYAQDSLAAVGGLPDADPTAVFSTIMEGCEIDM
eukprot:jgi/Ulvmu1/2334/UM013_0182.1